MTTWREAPGAATAPRTEPAAVTIGAFDGVHRGHQALLRRTREAGDGLPVVAVTFDPHPVAVVAPDRVPPRLTSLQRRIELLHAHGADEVRVLAFDREMSSMSPRDFVTHVLAEQLACGVVVVGRNFRFGARAAGDVDLLTELGPELGYASRPLDLAGDGETWSSTRVRTLVAAGDLDGAAQVLGRPHEVEGVVTRGDQRGRDLGFPTANVPVDASWAVPPDGVYAGRVVDLDGSQEPWPAAISIGTNPTFDGTERRVESYVMDHGHDLDLYGRRIRVELVRHLRSMVAYRGVEALVEQMHADVAAARDALHS
ncbi:MAG: bifunctional riboflavin kinase/FAD synthetase [Aeromicrobium erythreum]